MVHIKVYGSLMNLLKLQIDFGLSTAANGIRCWAFVVEKKWA
jgi:hypothetical protein